MNNSLENAKVGDKLIMTSRWATSILVVEKVQKNFVIANSYKFRKANGSLVTSDHWRMVTAKIATEEDLAAFRKAQNHRMLADKCRDIKLRIYPTLSWSRYLKLQTRKRYER